MGSRHGELHCLLAIAKVSRTEHKRKGRMSKYFKKMLGARSSTTDASSASSSDARRMSRRNQRSEEEVSRETDLSTAMMVQQLADEEAAPRSRPRGSVDGHQVINRNREAGHKRLLADYFVDHPVYDDTFFRRR